jgi:hypothetical protein
MSSTQSSNTNTNTSQPTTTTIVPVAVPVSIAAPQKVADRSVAAAEYRVATKWDQCLENTLVKTGLGIVTCGAASLLLFSKFKYNNN